MKKAEELLKKYTEESRARIGAGALKILQRGWPVGGVRLVGSSSTHYVLVHSARAYYRRARAEMVTTKVVEPAATCARMRKKERMLVMFSNDRISPARRLSK